MREIKERERETETQSRKSCDRRYLKKRTAAFQGHKQEAR